jgi:DDE family transposase
MSESCRSLIEVLAELQDPRMPRGKRHPFRAIVALAVVATLCGYKSYGAMADWGRNYGAALAHALGFTRPKTPCAATFYHLFRRLDPTALERLLSAWAHEILAATPPPKGEPEPIAIDGKTLRGSKHQGALNVHLLSALSQRLGVTLFQSAVSDKTNEIGAIQEVLSALVLEGRVVTVDALLCQRKVAEAIVSRGGTT